MPKNGLVTATGLPRILRTVCFESPILIKCTDFGARPWITPRATAQTQALTSIPQKTAANRFIYWRQLASQRCLNLSSRSEHSSLMNSIRHTLGKHAALIQALTWLIAIGMPWAQIMFSTSLRTIGNWLPASVAIVIFIVPLAILAYFLGRRHIKYPDHPKLRFALNFSPWALGLAWVITMIWVAIGFALAASLPDV